VAEALEMLFSEESGALYLTCNGDGLLEQVARWGPEPTPNSVLRHDDCWCLRRGKEHVIEPDQHAQVCRHMAAAPPAGSICAPLVAQGEVLGMLHVRWSGAPGRREASQRLATTVVDHVALGVANLRLRERLHELSLRDPLTGLFNRRTMEECLEREGLRAQRHGTSVGVVMIDVDHFKPFNDTHGHEAGDSLLRSLGVLLSGAIRGEDIACRYGGEEFTLVLPGAGLADTLQRAEEIRSRVAERLTVDTLHGPAGVTISAGVSVFPLHGTTVQGAVQAADVALYQAKAAGRNRVAAAPSATSGEAGKQTTIRA